MAITDNNNNNNNDHSHFPHRKSGDQTITLILILIFNFEVVIPLEITHISKNGISFVIKNINTDVLQHGKTCGK